MSELPGYPWEARRHEGMAYVDEGAGDPVLLLHGEPTWSYLYRRVIPPLADHARVVAPDFYGFGRSDKPTDQAWYSYDRHVASIHALVEALDLRRITVVVQDWGGPIGMRVATEAPERFDRLVVLNTALEPKRAFVAVRCVELPRGFGLTRLNVPVTVSAATGTGASVHPGERQGTSKCPAGKALVGGGYGAPESGFGNTFPALRPGPSLGYLFRNVSPDEESASVALLCAPKIVR